MEIRHDASGLRFTFNALGALRVWASLDLKPIHVQHAWSGRYGALAKSSDFDYTFTTSYPGEMDVAEIGTGLPNLPDSSTMLARPAVDLAGGAARSVSWKGRSEIKQSNRSLLT